MPSLAFSIFVLDNRSDDFTSKVFAALVEDGGEDNAITLGDSSRSQQSAEYARTFRAVTFKDLDALRILTEIPREIEEVATDSLRAAVEMTRFLLELLCKGQFLPILSDKIIGDRTQLTIRWEIAFANDALREKFRTIAGALPSILTRSHLTPESYLQEFLLQGATLLCRTFARSMTREDSRLDFLRDSAPEKVSEAFLLCLEKEFVPAPPLGNQLRRTLQEFQTWGRRYRLSSERPDLTLHLKLREPKKGSDQWRLEPGLGVKLLPDRYLLASQLKTGETGVLGRYGYHLAELDEIFIRKIVDEVEILPFLARTLDRDRTAACLISSEEAYDFLTVRSDELIRRGIILDLPSWWQSARPELSLNLKLSPTGTSGPQSLRETKFGLSTLVDFQWSVALDGEELTQDEFELIVQTKKPLVFIRGRWVEINSRKLGNTARLISPDKRRGQMRLVDALRQSSQLEDEDYLPVKRLEADGWLAPLINGATTTIPRRDQPTQFLGELREYQRQGLDWMKFLSDAGIGGCLADDMGLGKTVQFLALLLAEREELEAQKMQFQNGSFEQTGEKIDRKLLPTLLVVPMSILGNWQRECEKFAPQLKVLLHHGADRLTGARFRDKASQSDLVLTTYSLAHRDEELLRNVEWQRITLDEAQSIKNLNTKQSRSIRKIIEEQLTVIGRERPVERLALT